MSYDALLARVHEIYDLRKAARVLAWDREVAMPQGGDADRVQQIATLKRLSHSLYTAVDMGQLIEAAAAELNGTPYLTARASLVRFLLRDYDRARRLPAELVSRSATVSSQAITAWKAAREASDYALFAPWLARIVDLARETAELLGYEDEPYDALLNQHEPGARTAEVAALFQTVKEALLPLYQEIGRHRSRVDDSFLRQRFDIGRQEQFARYLAAAVGYDFGRGNLATAVHPFSTSLSRNDVRITTRYSPDSLSASMFATLHEAGHAIYIQNVHPDLNRTPLAKETSAGFDESQSRLIENLVGRSRGFWHVHLPRLKATFPDQLADVSLEQFYRAINKVQPGFIRVEADELTYNMHIILRFELEQALLSGRLAVADLPEAWNQKMRDFLGIVPGEDRLGCLQDIHWAMVGFGYFPTYALGNLYAAQLYEAALAQRPALASDLAAGQIGPLLSWLHENVHQFGRMLTPQELIVHATGRPLDGRAFVAYMWAKFSDVYRL